MQRLHYQSLIFSFKYAREIALFDSDSVVRFAKSVKKLPRTSSTAKASAYYRRDKVLPSGGLILQLSKERRHSHREAPQPQRGTIATERRHCHRKAPQPQQQTDRAKTCAFCARCQFKVSLVRQRSCLVILSVLVLLCL